MPRHQRGRPCLSLPTVLETPIRLRRCRKLPATALKPQLIANVASSTDASVVCVLFAVAVVFFICTHCIACIAYSVAGGQLTVLSSLILIYDQVA